MPIKRPPSPPLHQVQAFKEHHAAVTDLSFDAEAEYLASCSADGWVVVCLVHG